MRWALKGSIFEGAGENGVETDELSIAIVANGDKMGLRVSCRCSGTSRRSSGCREAYTVVTCYHI